MIPIRAEIHGIKELTDWLQRFGPSTQRRILRPALANEGTKVLQQARANVPVATRLLKKSLIRKVKTYKNGNVSVIIGPRSNYESTVGGKLKKPSRYAHLVEFGARPHSIATRVGGRKVYGRKKRNYTMVLHPGMKGRKPMTRAAKTALNGAAERMAQRMAREIETLAGKNKLRMAT